MNDYITYKKSHYSDDLKYLEKFIFSFGSNYALGVQLLPKKIREATIIFYGFVRYADELVDNPELQIPNKTHSNINTFIREWEQTLDHEPNKNTHPTIRAVYWLFLEYKIPFNYIEDFLYTMQQDIKKERYENYSELKKYMWGSASVIGHIMTYIIGYSNPICFDNAQALGEAMQLANFLRDINEDYQERNRIYLPQQDMFIFGVHDEMIENQIMTPGLRNLIHHYNDRTEGLFNKGIRGIKYLKHGKFSILLASRMYRENIRILRKRNFDIFGSKIRLSKWHKFRILISTIAIYPFWLLKNKF